MMSSPDVPILMFHSVSDVGPGPVSIGRKTFREQLAVLRDAGALGMSVSDYVAARASLAVPSEAVVLTFDDGYRDFAEAAFPDLQAAGWGCTVFLPVVPIDREQPWDCGDGFARELLTWRQVRDLTSSGVEFGAHSMTHRDLTRLSPDEARDEITSCGRSIQEQTGRPVEGFAPPFGRITSVLRDELKSHYRWSVGTTLGRAGDDSDYFDLPRIEMWYFQDIGRWRRYVSRRWTPYFALRRLMRAAREMV